MNTNINNNNNASNNNNNNNTVSDLGRARFTPLEDPAL